MTAQGMALAPFLTLKSIEQSIEHHPKSIEVRKSQNTTSNNKRRKIKNFASIYAEKNAHQNKAEYNKRQEAEI